MTVAAPADPPAHPAATRRPGRRCCSWPATAAALALALRAPLLLTVLGLVTFGVLHNALELRYVTGRFAGILRGRCCGRWSR